MKTEETKDYSQFRIIEIKYDEEVENYDLNQTDIVFNTKPDVYYSTKPSTYFSIKFNTRIVFENYIKLIDELYFKKVDKNLSYLFKYNFYNTTKNLFSYALNNTFNKFYEESKKYFGGFLLYLFINYLKAQNNSFELNINKTTTLKHLDLFNVYFVNNFKIPNNDEKTEFFSHIISISKNKRSIGTILNKNSLRITGSGISIADIEFLNWPSIDQEEYLKTRPFFSDFIYNYVTFFNMKNEIINKIILLEIKSNV